MIFVLHQDKLINGTCWVPAGPYNVIRIFDKDRVLVDLNPMDRLSDKEKRITLLRKKNGEMLRGTVWDLRSSYADID